MSVQLLQQQNTIEECLTITSAKYNRRVFNYYISKVQERSVQLLHQQNTIKESSTITSAEYNRGVFNYCISKIQ